ncbi:MAG: cytidylate kinase-like family protein [Clostridia bacterium]|nr:cytidylate kinase-like family protein [Clostridia bacterium]
MTDQLIIAVSREFGSGGHFIAEQLAKTFQIPFYDRNLLWELANERNLDISALTKYDEVPKRRLLSRKVRGFNNSPEENIARLQFDYLKKKAAEGESFVVVGRCAETVLRDHPALISVFILADEQSKLERICRLNNLSPDEAAAMIARCNKQRKAYHNSYCPVKWGDSRGYDLCINDSRLGVDGTAAFIEQYIRKRFPQL